MNNYKEKYLKYKLKYIKLKELQGGNPGINIPRDISLPETFRMFKTNFQYTLQEILKLAKLFNSDKEVETYLIKLFNAPSSDNIDNDLINDKIRDVLKFFYYLYKLYTREFYDTTLKKNELRVDSSLFNNKLNSMSPTVAQRSVYFGYMFHLTESEIDELNKNLTDNITYQANIIKCILYIKTKNWDEVNTYLAGLNLDNLQEEIANKRLSYSELLKITPENFNAQLKGGNPDNVCDMILLFQAFTKQFIDSIKEKAGPDLYKRFCKIVKKNKISIPILGDYIESIIKDPIFQIIFNKYITLIENNIEHYYAIDLTKMAYSVDEILKYKDFSPNFISEILNFTQEQKDRLHKLIMGNILQVLAYYIVKNNKTQEQESEILKIYNVNPNDHEKIRQALELARTMT